MEEVTAKRTVDVDSPEIQNLMKEILSQSEAIKKREELTEKSFWFWFCEVLEKVASQMGMIIQNLYEIPADLGYSFQKGFAKGREKARQSSYRAKDKMKEQN